MINIKTLPLPFDIESKYSSSFKVKDPFNPCNILEGYIYRSGTTKYGMMLLTKINEWSCQQIVWGTPKQYYPFNKGEKRWQFPEYDEIRIYEKIDGTNILAYKYKYKNKTYVTYKTRLRPILGSSEFGNFEALWKEMIKKYPEIPTLPLKNNCNISFELYGKRNKILIDYETPLDCAVLFGRLDDGKIITPESLKVNGVPLAKRIIIEKSGGGIDYLKNKYENMERWLENNLKKYYNKNKNLKNIKGVEGSVWYFTKNNEVVQIKCKPKTIKDIHFFSAGGIPNHSIYITVMNAFEDVDEPTYNYVKSLLLEEFTEEKIERKKQTIKKTLNSILLEKKWRHQIIEEYRAHPEFNIKEDRGSVMRFFSKKYSKSIAKKIFTILWNEFGGEND